MVPGAEIERVADEQRRRLDHSGVESPEQVAAIRIPREDETSSACLVRPARLAVHERLVDDAVLNRRRGGDAVIEAPHPDALAAARLDDVEGSLLLRDVEISVRDRGRKLDVALRLQLPEPVVRRADPPGKRCQVRALRVVPVRRPWHRIEPAWFRPLRVRTELLDELLRGRAAHGARAVLVPCPGAQRRARSERADRDRDHRPAEQPEPAVEQAPDQSEHRPDAEQEHRAVVDRAFDRCREQQDRRRLAIAGQ